MSSCALAHHHHTPPACAQLSHLLPSPCRHLFEHGLALLAVALLAVIPRPSYTATPTTPPYLLHTRATHRCLSRSHTHTLSHSRACALSHAYTRVPLGRLGLPSTPQHLERLGHAGRLNCRNRQRLPAHQAFRGRTHVHPQFHVCRRLRRCHPALHLHASVFVSVCMHSDARRTLGACVSYVCRYTCAVCVCAYPTHLYLPVTVHMHIHTHTHTITHTQSHTHTHTHTPSFS